METNAENIVPMEQPPEDLFIFSKAKIHIDQIIQSWGEDIRQAEMRRKERYVDIDIEQLRVNGDIAEDETFIPDRVIDTNINRENSDIMTFLNAGYRLAIFDCLSDPSIDTRKLELDVTKGLTYSGWYREFKRISDGAELHGLDHMEVVFDQTKPLHVGFEHVGFDRLFYNRKVANIQDSERVIRKYEVTLYRLEQFKQNGFAPDQIDALSATRKDSRRQDTVIIYKVYFKYQEVVYLAWYCGESAINDWLKAPEQLRLGIYDKDQMGQYVESNIDQYPIFTYLYKDDEQEPLIDHKGRGFLDSPLQEASTAITTSFVNGCLRAAAVYASPKQSDGDTSEMKQLDLKLIPDGIYNTPIDFWSKPQPDVTQLQALAYLSTKNAEQTGKIAAAVSNRKDARKTKAELNYAQGEEQKNTSTGLASFSEFLRDELTFAWRIIQSQALQNKITLLLTEVPNQLGQPQMTNDIKTISQVFDIRPAGDTDVVEAQQQQQMMMQDWPVLQTTPLASKFLSDYVKLRYPKKSDEYLQILQAGSPQQLVASLAALLKGSLQPQEIAAMTPQQQQQLQQIQQQTQAYLQANAPKGAEGAK